MADGNQHKTLNLDAQIVLRVSAPTKAGLFAIAEATCDEAARRGKRLAVTPSDIARWILEGYLAAHPEHGPYSE